MEVSTDALGDCSVSGASSVTQTTAACDGEVVVTGVVDNVDLTSTGLETNVGLELDLASISDSATGGTINSDDGDVLLTVPANGNFSILALTQQGVVDTGTLPNDCEEQVAEERSKTVTCGTGGPEYEVNACLDGVGECNIVISYR